MVEFINTSHGEMVVDVCCNCGAAHAFPKKVYNQMLQDRGPRGKTVCCPNGHTWHYVGETEADKQRRRAERAEQTAARLEEEAESERRRAAAARGQITRLRNRAKAGLCPRCNRHFDNLQRHIETKHPDINVVDFVPREAAS